MKTTPSLTLFFIVEPPQYQYMACYLAASVRTHFSNDVKLIGYCPEHCRDGIHPTVVEAMRRMDVEIRTFMVSDQFHPTYPHGNKILACMEPRDTDFSGFMDTDILCLRDNTVENLSKAGHVSVSPAASMYWAEDTIWETIYKACGLDIPQERIWPMRDRRASRIPYFSSGLVVFPEKHRNPEGKSFPQVWFNTAKIIDAVDGLASRRPYLDQMALPIAIQTSGLKWNILPEEQHYILDRALSNAPFPTEQGIFTVHYRNADILHNCKLDKISRVKLKTLIGVGWVKRIFRKNYTEDS